MKTYKGLLIILMFGCFNPVNAQFLKKLGEKAEKAAERTIERRVERKASEKTDQAMDSVFENKKGKKSKKNKKKGKNSSETGEAESGSTNNSVHSNFDFEPGTVTIFEDTFERDRPGDFPAKWDTNGSGEIVTINNKKWFRLTNNSVYLPMLNKDLPENYTIEFDLITKGLDQGTSSQAFVKLIIDDNKSFNNGRNRAMAEISPCQFINSPGVVEKYVNGNREIRNNIGKDYREEIKGNSKISMAVNKTRFRVWLNDNKIVDVPRLVPEGTTTFKIITTNLRDAKDLDEIYITNFKIAKAEEDLRSKLLNEGKISTTGIYFSSGSAGIEEESRETLDAIAKVLHDTKIPVKIVGHTDGDGSAEANLKLSKERADAVKNTLILDYGIKESSLTTEGKGEAEPVADNSSAAGKSQNRRVEFIKM